MNKTKVIILAAGKGSRISMDIENIPKSLLKINEKTIIYRTVEMLQEINCQVVVCTGYKHDLIERELNGLDVMFYYNPFYEVCNNIASLWFAREEFDGQADLIIMSADVVAEKALLDFAIKEPSEAITMFGDKKRVLDGDYFLRTIGDQIIEYGSGLAEEVRDYEYIGISAIKAEYVKTVRTRLEEMIEQGALNEYYEQVLFSFIGHQVLSPKCKDVSGLCWHEIDRIEDYNLAVRKFSEK